MGDEAVHGAKQRRLPRPTAPHDYHDLALLHAQRYTVENPLITVMNDQILDFDHRCKNSFGAPRHRSATQEKGENHVGNHDGADRQDHGTRSGTPQTFRPTGGVETVAGCHQGNQNAEDQAF